MIEFPRDFKAFSSGGYSSFYYLPTWKTLFDCGDGVVARLGPRVGGLKRLFLTHGHLDHLTALPSILWAREVGLGDNNRALAVYYPRGDWRVLEFQKLISQLQMSAIEWHELDAGQSVSWSNCRVETFQTQHIHDALTVGYKLWESKTVLRAEFADLPQEEIIARRRAGTFEEISENRETCPIAFCGDSTPVEAEKLAGAKIIVHEATALSEKDLGTKNHSTLEQALEVGQNALPEKLVLTHFSTRYTRSQIAEIVAKTAREMEVSFEVWCVWNREVWRAN